MKKAAAFSVLKTVHLAMLFGQLLFISILFYLVYSKKAIPPLAEQDRIFQVIAILFAGLAFFIGFNIFKKRLAVIRDKVHLTTMEKFDKYRSACIIQWALLEGAALFCGICFFLTGNYAFLALAALLILFFAMQVPHKNKTAQQLGLGTDDIDAL